MEVPATLLLGCPVNATRFAGPEVMLKEALVALVKGSELAESVYPLPDLLIERFENVATPLTAATVSVPLRVPLPGLVPMAIVTFAVDDVTRLSLTSRTST